MPTVNLRTGLPLRFGDERSQSDYERKVDALRARLGHEGRFAVAPGMTIRSKLRGVLREGVELTIDDIGEEWDARGRVVATPAARWRRLVADGVIVEGGW